MTVRELIAALNDLIVDDDIGANVANMEVWIPDKEGDVGDFCATLPSISSGRVWL